jgi:hypothetical protein
LFASAVILMPIAYERDDERRLITVTMTEPYSVDDVLGVIDRQAAEDTWGYSMLYDLRAVTQPSTEAELQQVANRVSVVGGGRERGPVGLVIGARPAIFRMGLMYTDLAVKREIGSVEVLMTAKQLDEWLARNARGGSSRRRNPT